MGRCLPSHEEHCEESFKKYGKTFSDLHRWMDEPSTLLGKGHRRYRHDPIQTPLLAKKLFGELADQACLDHIRLDELESRRNQQPLELTDQTKWFVNFLFPPFEEIISRPKTSYDVKNIKFSRMLVYYNATDSFNARKNIVDKLTEWAIEKYGKKNVNARIALDGNLQSFIKWSLDKKPIQIGFADQFALFLKSKDGRSIERDLTREYLSLSNLWSEKTGRKSGLIIIFLASHSLRLPSEFMYDWTAILFRNSPTTRQDHYEMRDLIGEEAITYLKEIEQLRKKNTDFVRKSLFWTKDKIGILETPPAKRNYWKEAFDFIEIMDNLDRSK